MMSTRARSTALVMRSLRVTADTFRQPLLTHFPCFDGKFSAQPLLCVPFFTSFGRKRLRQSTDSISAAFR